MKNKYLIAFLFSTMLRLSYGDLGIMDTPSEIAAKTEASNSGVTQIYDHPDQSPNGKYYVPVEYNRTNAEGNGQEHDADNSKKNDIDYIPLSELKGAKGDKGETGSVDESVVNNINTNISNETNSRITADTNLTNNLKTTNERVDNLDGRVNDLERTKVILDGSLRLADSKHVTVYMFDAYNWMQRRNDSYGVRFVVKLGKSYEETLLEKQELKIRQLERLINLTYHTQKGAK